MEVLLHKKGKFENPGLYRSDNFIVRKDIMDLLQVLARTLKVLAYTPTEFSVYSVTSKKLLVSFGENTKNN